MGEIIYSSALDLKSAALNLRPAPKRPGEFLRFLCFCNFHELGFRLGDEANPGSMEGYSKFVARGFYGRKVGKPLRKNMRKPHFSGREGRKVTNSPPRAVKKRARGARGLRHLAGSRIGLKCPLGLPRKPWT